MGEAVPRRTDFQYSLRCFRAVVTVSALASPFAVTAQVPDVGPSGCVANCDLPSTGSSSSGSGSGSNAGRALERERQGLETIRRQREAEAARTSSKARAKAKMGYEYVIPLDTPTTAPRTFPIIQPKLIATVRQCRRNLEHRKVLAGRLGNLEKVAGEQRLRREKMGKNLYHEEDVLKTVAWDALEGLASSSGYLLGKKLEALKKVGKISNAQADKVTLAQNTLSAALVAGRPAKTAEKQDEKVLDAANNLLGMVAGPVLAGVMEPAAVDALTRMVSIQVEVIKSAGHMKDPTYQKDAMRKIEDAISLAGAAYKPIAAAKGAVSIGMGSWYLAATRGNLKALQDSLAGAMKAEILLNQRVEALREKVKVYDKDVALCG